MKKGHFAQNWCFILQAKIIRGRGESDRKDAGLIPFWVVGRACGFNCKSKTM